MYIKEIWRFPVKSAGGERIERATISPMGIEGDRIAHVRGPEGHMLTSRTHHRLLGLHGTLDARGESLVDGHPWNSDAARELVERAAGAGARLVSYTGPKRFDVLPLLVATDGALAAFSHDGRRLRYNILVGGVPGMAERGWPGKFLRTGGVVIGVQDLRARCVMTTYDPDTLKQSVNVLREIVEKFDGELALNCFVVRGGQIREGDAVELASEPGN